MKSEKRVVVIGGGTGSFTVLSALKETYANLTAIVTMADDGGSTGTLRDELGVLPPGDVRQCLVALSESPKIRDLFNYRFNEGTFGGHSFGNIFLTALEKLTGNFAEAIETASEVLRVNGRVLPATFDNVRLKMSWDDKSVTLHGEHVIDADAFSHDPRKARLHLEPNAKANPAALEAIQHADMIVIAPGDLYTSLGPLLVIDGFGDALASCAGKVLYVCNLVTKRGQTEGFDVVDHASEIERFAGQPILDFVLYNDQSPAPELVKKYHEEGAAMVQPGESLEQQHYSVVASGLLGKASEKAAGDELASLRSFIRHDEAALAASITFLLNGASTSE
jgi:uncharacterized cofD-like protein